MSLLTNVMDHSLDDGYAEAAARKRAQGGGGGLPKTLRARLGLGAGLVLAALVVTVGAAQARVTAPVIAKEREELIDRIEDETAAADKLEKNVDTLRDDVDDRRREALRHEEGADDLIGVLAGSAAVHGPGVKLSVDDAKEADGNGDGPRGRPVSPTRAGSRTATCNASSTDCGSPGRRPSRSTGSGSRPCPRSGRRATPYSSTTGPWCRLTPSSPWATENG